MSPEEIEEARRLLAKIVTSWEDNGDTYEVHNLHRNRPEWLKKAIEELRERQRNENE